MTPQADRKGSEGSGAKVIKLPSEMDVPPVANCPAEFLSYFSLWICYERD